MLLLVSAAVNDLDGNPVREPGSNDKPGETTGKIFTIGRAIESALVNSQPGDEKDGEGSFKRFRLAMKIHDAPDGLVEIDIDEAKIIKDRVGSTFGALVIGRVWNALENTTQAKPNGASKVVNKHAD